MDWESGFRLANLLALAGWAILLVVPRRLSGLRQVAGYWLPGILAAGYFVLVAVWFAGAEGGYSSLAQVGRLFASEPVRLAGWLHYLAFDLFVGAWIAREADARGISRLVLAPLLVATFLFGPVGLLGFLPLRARAARRAGAPAGVAP